MDVHVMIMHPHIYTLYNMLVLTHMPTYIHAHMHAYIHTHTHNTHNTHAHTPHTHIYVGGSSGHAKPTSQRFEQIRTLQGKRHSPSQIHPLHRFPSPSEGSVASCP